MNPSGFTLGVKYGLLCCLVGVNLAHGQPTDALYRLQDARLIESLDGDLRGALLIYEDLLGQVEVGDENWDLCQFSIARVRLGLGELEEARLALGMLSENSVLNQEARNLYMMLEMLERSIQDIPYMDPIQSGRSRWIRGSMRGDLGDLHYDAETDGILSWDLQVVQSQTDFILLPLAAQNLPLQGFDFSARSREFTSSIIVILEDHDGGQWRTEILDLPANVWTFVSVDLTNLIRIQGESTMPDPHRLEALIIEDLTGQVSSRQGSNRIDIQSTRIY